MAAAGRYISQADVERRMTAQTIVDIFDDDNDGTIEDGGDQANEEQAIEDFILDAESDVEQVVQKTYGAAGLTWLRALDAADIPRSVKRMCLDLFEVRAMRRHPQYIRGDWKDREKSVQQSLERLRIRELELESDTEPEAQNEGGAVRSGDPDATTPVAKVFLDGMGGVF